jgi:type VI secretion system protein
MSLSLVWQSFRNARPPQQQTINLDEQGGSLGRALDNAFVVSDPERFASRYHARILASEGQYYIEDTSASGTLINNDIELLDGQSNILHHGDILTIGECDIEVQIHQLPNMPPQDLTDPTGAHLADQWSRVSEPPSPVDEGMFDIDDFFNMGSEPVEPSQAQVVSSPNLASAEINGAFCPIPPKHNANAIDHAFDLENLMSEAVHVDAQPASSQPIQPSQQPESQIQVDQDTIAIRAFLAELNIEPSDFIGQSKVEVMKVAGVILRTLTQGMMEVLQARSSIKKHFNMDTTQIKRVRNNPLKFSATSTEAMTHMLKQEKGYMDPIESAEEAVNDAKAHQMAMVSGLNAAIESTIAAFDPTRLEKEFNQDTSFTFSKKSKYWQRFHDKFKHIADEVESNSNNLFSQQFRQHYEQQIRTLSNDKPK